MQNVCKAAVWPTHILNLRPTFAPLPLLPPPPPQRLLFCPTPQANVCPFSFYLINVFQFAPFPHQHTFLNKLRKRLKVRKTEKYKMINRNQSCAEKNV